MKCKINLTEREINDYDFYKMKIIDGIRYIPTKIQYEIKKDSIRMVNAEFLTVL